MSYRIVDWDQNFENNRSRSIKTIHWVPVPNKMDGDGYTQLVSHEKGAAYFGAWIAILEIASKQDHRGTLPQKGAGFPQYLARLSRLPATLFEEVIPVLVKLQWLEPLKDTPQVTADLRQLGARIWQEGVIEEKGIEEKERKKKKSVATLPSRFDEWCKLYPKSVDRRDTLAAWKTNVTTPEETAALFDATRRYIDLLGKHPDRPCKGAGAFLRDRGRWEHPWSDGTGEKPRAITSGRIFDSQDDCISEEVFESFFNGRRAANV